MRATQVTAREPLQTFVHDINWVAHTPVGHDKWGNGIAKRLTIRQD
jgi:hypothetical protein